MKLMLGQTVYCVVEDFAPDFHYRIAKCKVESVPYGNLKEYKLLEKRKNKPLKVYWKQRNAIYDIYAQAIDEAEKNTDEYEKTWQRYTHQVLARPWRDDNGLEGN